MLLRSPISPFLAVLRLLVRRRRSEFAKDVELLELRHQLVVINRIGFANSISLQIPKIGADDRIYAPYAHADVG